MNRFNLTFRGEFLPGQDRERAKARFGQLFGIDDPTRLDSFFSGQTIILRRNLDRKTAAEYYAKLHALGMHAELVKVNAQEAANAVVGAVAAADTTKAVPGKHGVKKYPQQRKAEAAAQRKAKRAKKAARREAALEKVRRQTAARTTQEQVSPEEEQRLAAAKTVRKNAEQREQAAQHRAMEERAIDRGAQALAQQQPSLKPVSARVKTRLVTPRSTAGAEQSDSTGLRGGGAPNLYTVQPFRNTPAVRARAAIARQRMRQAIILAAVAAGCLLLAGVFLKRTATPRDNRVSAIAVEPGSGPLLLVGDQLLRHNRAGLGTQNIALGELGLADIKSPLAFTADGHVLVRGQLIADESTGADSTAATGDAMRLLRCNLNAHHCAVFSEKLDGIEPSDVAVHPLTGDLFLADAHAGQVYRLSRDGQVLGQAAMPLAPIPTLQLAAGLLFTNSANGPAISVFRYDAAAFGKQLDEMLLLPADMAITEQTRVRDFIRVADDWWVILSSPSIRSDIRPDTGSDTGEEGVFRFDAQGKYLGRIALEPHSHPRQLANWADKVLVRDEHSTLLQRFNASGVAEVPLRSDLLHHLLEREQHAAALAALARRVALGVLALATLGAVAAAYLLHARSLVYKGDRQRGAEPVDAIASGVRWLPLVADRLLRLRRTATAYGVLALALLALAVVAQITSTQLLAMLLALSGPAVALWLLYRSSPGHIGTAQRQLVLVDHNDMYHLGADARLLHRGPFLMLDDVVLFTGSRLLPAFPARDLREQVAALTGGGIGVDRKTVAVRLLQSRHPLALGAAAIAAGLILALLALVFSVPA